MNRRDGYVIDVPYPLHFHKEMQPVWLSHIAETLACSAPDISQPYDYCELGCGAGINLLVAAAANPLGRYTGIDFNEHHIATARATARQAGIDNVTFVHAGFEDPLHEPMPSFDFIVCHGVWSWLPARMQAALLQRVHQTLKPQGLLYLHYMSHPGATRLTALQKVLLEVSRASQRDSLSDVRQGMALLRQLADANAGIFVDSPELHKELLALENEDPAYLAHDFLTEHWQPQHSADVQRLIAQIGLSYLGSANSFENMDGLSVPAQVQPLLGQLPNRALRETVKDLARNQHQRMDLFQRSPRPLSEPAHAAALARTRFAALPGLPPPGELQFKTPIGTITGPAPLFGPLLQALAAGAASFGTLAALPPFEREPGLLLQALGMLMWAGHVHPLRRDDAPAPAATRLQAWLDRQGLPLTIVPDCGTGVMRA